MKYSLGKLAEIIPLLHDQLNIAVIYSGDNRQDGSVVTKTYHPRVWKSYEGVAWDIQETLQEIGFTRVHLLTDDMSLPQQLQKLEINVAWLNTGGVQGRNALAHTPGILEMMGIPYIGHSPLNYALLDHKVTLKRMMRSMGIPTPDFIAWDPYYTDGPKELVKHAIEELGTGKLVVKPVTGRASLYIHIVENARDLPEAVADIYQKTYNQVLIEKFLPGREYCVSGGAPIVYRNDAFIRMPDPFTFSFIERILEPDEEIFTSIDTRELNHSRIKLLDETEDHRQIRRLSKVCSFFLRNLSLKYLIRVDLREDQNGVLNVLEINPKPDLKKPQENNFSLVAIGLEKQNMSYCDLIMSQLGAFLDLIITCRPVSAPGLINMLNRVGLEPYLPVEPHSMLP